MYIRTYVLMYVCMYARMHVCMYVCTRIYVHTCVCMYVRMSTYTYSPATHIHTHTHLRHSKLLSACGLRELRLEKAELGDGLVLERLLRQYLYFCTSKASKVSTLSARSLASWSSLSANSGLSGGCLLDSCGSTVVNALRVNSCGCSC